MRPLPETNPEWLAEIAAAYQDARETLPFVDLVDVAPSEEVLFHLAPHIAIKFRGLRRSRAKAAVDAALTSYVATQDRFPQLFENPHISFAFCYLASHFGLGLVTEQDVDEVMTFVECNTANLSKGINRLLMSSPSSKRLSV